MCPLNICDLHRIFESLDQNGDGLLSLGELSSLLERIGIRASADELISLVGGSGLDFDEFSLFYKSISKNKSDNVVTLDNRGYEKDEEADEELYRAFKVFDVNGDGLISSQELQSVLWRLGMWDNSSGVIDCERIIRKFDVNSDGFVDFEEFKRMMFAKYEEIL